MKINYDFYDFSRKEKLAFYAGYALSALAVSLLFYRTVFLSPLLLPFMPKVMEYVRSALNDRRRRKLLEEFKDMLFMVSTSIGAGRSIKAAIAEAVPGVENIYGADSRLVPELKDMCQRMEAGNEKDTEVLMDFAVRTGLEDVIDFVNIYSTCKLTGASLIVALNRAASVIIDKMSIDKEIREAVRRKEREGILIFVMPVVVILFLNVFAPDYIGPLYSTAAGRVIMTAVIASNIAIYGMIRKITSVEI